MIKIPTIVSIKSFIFEATMDGRNYPGILLAESYEDGNVVILERIYNDLTDLEVDLAVAQNREKYPIILLDHGQLYEDSVPNKER